MSSKRKAEAGHRDHFGAPALKGWPTFGKDGKIVRAHAPEVDVIHVSNPGYTEPCRSALALSGQCVRDEPCAAVCKGGRS